MELVIYFIRETGYLSQYIGHAAGWLPGFDYQ